MVPTDPRPALSGNDFRLIEEAMRRLHLPLIDRTIGREAMVSILTDEIRRGRRDLFSLTKAGQRVLETSSA